MELAIFGACAAAVILVGVFPVRKAWRSYAEAARLKPDEQILYEEDDVRVVDHITGFGAFLSGDWSRHWYPKLHVTITDQRILQWRKRHPCGVVNYMTVVSEPKLWRFLHPLYHVNAHDISFATDRKGDDCLRVSARKWGCNIVRHYYFRDSDAVKSMLGARPSSQSHEGLNSPTCDATA